MFISFRTTKSIVGLLVCLVGLGACGGQTRSPDTIRYDRLAIQDYPQIVMLDKTRLVVALQDRPVAGVQDSGVYKVRVPLRSVASNTASLRYRFIYFDGSGVEIDRDTWSSVTVPARSAFQITGKSISDGIREWRLEIGRLHGLDGSS